MVQPEPVDSAQEPIPADAGTEPSAESEPEDTFDGGAFNPDQLPPELQPGWRQLQAAFTRKTQELAEERRQLDSQLASLGDAEQVQQAMELFTAMQDPRNWVQLHEELSTAMQQYGLTPAQADQAAAEALAQQQEPGTPDLTGLSDDPDLAPLANSVQAMQQRLEAFEQQQQQALMARQAELEQQQHFNELMHQVNQIQQSNPTYDEDDITSILELSSFYNGDLARAQERYEAGIQRRLGRYLAGKQEAQDLSSSQPPTGSTAAATPVEAPETTDGFLEWAEEHLRQLQAAGELD